MSLRKRHCIVAWRETEDTDWSTKPLKFDHLFELQPDETYSKNSREQKQFRTSHSVRYQLHNMELEQNTGFHSIFCKLDNPTERCYSNNFPHGFPLKSTLSLTLDFIDLSYEFPVQHNSVTKYVKTSNQIINANLTRM